MVEGETDLVTFNGKCIAQPVLNVAIGVKCHSSQQVTSQYIVVIVFPTLVTVGGAISLVGHTIRVKRDPELATIITN